MRPRPEEVAGSISAKDEPCLSSTEEKVANLVEFNLDFVEQLPATGMVDIGKDYSPLKPEVQGILNAFATRTKTAARSSIPTNTV